MVSFGKGGIALILGVIGLAACGTGAPPNDVSASVGFQDYQAYQARRAALRGEPPAAERTVVPPSAPAMARVTAPPPEAAQAPPSVPTARAPQPAAPATPPAPLAARDVASIAAAAIAAVEPAPNPQQAAVTPVTPTSAPLPQPMVANPGISDEQDFDAVAGRETIESDAERRARMQAERVVIQPTAVPERPSGLGANIIDYALSTSHPVGARVHPRRPISASRHQRNCLAFRAPDLAQEWFLQNGGPTRDRQGLDPDGDGYACAWDPGIYRAAAAAARN